MICTLCKLELSQFTEQDIINCAGVPPDKCPQNNAIDMRSMLRKPVLSAEANDLVNHPPHDSLLQERKKTHGSFAQNAVISQHIKHIYHSMGKYPTESAVHAEALDMIALKLSRILSGQANFKDHWDDIAGYAKLASEACK